ncbi:hypothetical protein [Aeromonas sp. QDB63]|uniref:hypothetical protein n=1 Tax=Aeromonas sp. QDB63 TaxID=2989825 RepID=UPI0022E255DA|nr:hypothetical protein [Aeromonas sp. QDB63]
MKNLHSVTDKAISDALSQSKITSSELSELFLSRGILISRTTERKELARYFSRFYHDYYDHQTIAAQLGVHSRKERVTSKIIHQEINPDDILKSANLLKKEIESHDDYCSVRKIDNTIYINIKYLSTDYTKSDFRQVVNKEAMLELECDNGKITIRRPDNDQLEEYETSLLKKIEANVKSSLPEAPSLTISEVTLINIPSPIARTNFFIKLLKELNGYEFDDVTDAYVYHLKPSNITPLDENEDGDGDGDDIEFGVHISKASLKGEGVLKSEELRQLYERGFYICKIRWRIKEKTYDHDIYEIEAQFNNQEECSGFSYVTKGVKRYRSQGEHTKNFVPLTKSEDLKLCRLIEQTAYSIVNNPTTIPSDTIISVDKS